MRAEEVLAGNRDASVYNSPGAISRLHVYAGKWQSGCGVPMHMDDAQDAARVPSALRCRRNGCRQRWPKEVADAR